jgi:hypothetical protein
MNKHDWKLALISSLEIAVVVFVIYFASRGAV